MRHLIINVVSGIRSTGRICTDLADKLSSQGHEVKIAYGRESVPEKYKKYSYRINNNLDVYIDVLQSRLLGEAGFYSKRVTKKFIKWIEKFNPDVIHLELINGYYINIEVLFDYLKKSGKKIYWRLHSCENLTGHCMHFEYIKCDKWKKECYDCPQWKEYPESWFFDRSRDVYRRKKAAFSGVPNLTIITPSKWLAEIVKESYLKEYPIQIEYNKIDRKVFKPTNNDIKKHFNIEDKKIVLGVSSAWRKQKGIGDFIDIANILGREYVIILVGMTKEQCKLLGRKIKNVPQYIKEERAFIFKLSKEKKYGINISNRVKKAYQVISGKEFNGEINQISRLICVERTNNVVDLAKFYTAADYFFNPTQEDNYPTVNLEAEACGTPVITYNTGGCSETIRRADSVLIE